MSRHSPRHSSVSFVDPSIIGADTLDQYWPLQCIIKVDKIVLSSTQMIDMLSVVNYIAKYDVDDLSIDRVTQDDQSASKKQSNAWWYLSLVVRRVIDWFWSLIIRRASANLMRRCWRSDNRRSVTINCNWSAMSVGRCWLTEGTILPAKLNAVCSVISIGETKSRTWRRIE